MNNSGIEIFKTDDGQTKIQVKLDSETVWLNQKQMSQLFEKDADTIGLHLQNIYKSGELLEISTARDFSVVQKELERKATVAKFATVQIEGNRELLQKIINQGN